MAEALGGRRVVLARPVGGDWWLSAGAGHPHDGLYRSLLRSGALGPGLWDTSLMGDPGLRLRIGGVSRILCLDAPAGGLVLVENPRAEVVDDAGWFALVADMTAHPDPAEGPEVSEAEGPLTGADMAALARWAQLASRQRRQSPMSSSGARDIALALGVTTAVVMRPDADGLAAAVGSASAHGEVRLDLSWPLPPDSDAVSEALDRAAGSPSYLPWQVVGDAFGELAIALRPPTDRAGAAQVLADFLGAESERSRTNRAGRHRAMLEERMRIASLIHDGVTQQVSTVVIQLQLLELLLNDPVRLKETLVAARQSTQASLEELRSSVYELGPRLTDWDDLIGGLRSFAGDYSAQWGIDVEVKVDGAPRTVDGETTMLAYSVVQEGLSNVRKHAEADSVALEVQFGAAELKLGVKDDGAGFPVEAEGGRADSGLRLLRDRVQAAGGTLRVVSGPGTGTSLLVTLPLD